MVPNESIVGMDNFWEKAQAFWRTSRLLAWLLGVAWALAAIKVLWCSPSPGIAIGLLAAAAGIMSLRPPEMHFVERMAWIAILVALVTAEILAIKKSDEQNTAKNQEILNGMTGGDAYLFFSPYPKAASSVNDDAFSVQVFNNGKYTLWDVLVEMEEGAPATAEEFLKNWHPTRIPLGSVSNTYGTGLGDVVIHPTRDKKNIYTFRVFSRNSPTIEQLIMDFDQRSNQWEFSYRIWRYLPTPKIGGELIDFKEHQHIVKSLIVPIQPPSMQP